MKKDIIKIKRQIKEEYKQLIKKGKEKYKAKAIAKARLVEEKFKLFKKKEYKKINKQKFEPKVKTIKEGIDYNKFLVGKNKLILSTDEKILNKFEKTKRKGLIRNMTDDFEKDVLFTAQNKYNLTLDPDMFYVIKRIT